MRVPVRTAAEIDAALPRVVEHLQADGLIAYPTETVYGFGGVPSHAAVAALRDLKRRDAHKPFLILIDSPERAPGVQWNEAALAIAERCWPGPLTLVLPARPGAYPDGVMGPGGTVALRSSPHPFVRALVAAAGAVTSTSANAPGSPPAADAAEVERALEALGARAEVLVLDGGELPPSLPSTIVAADADGRARILRHGALTTEQLQNQLAGTGIDVSQ